MKHIYEELLTELEIKKADNSFEIWKQLRSKAEEYKVSMTSKNSVEENACIEKTIHAIHEAEKYYEELAQEEKKADKLDGFDYNSLKNKKKRGKRQRINLSETFASDVNTGDTDDVEEAAVEELSYEERYDNIIGFMGTPGGFEEGVEQLKQLAEDGYAVAQNRLGNLYYTGEKGIAADYEEAVYWYEKAAEGGYTDAYNQLGVIYINHLPNRDKAMHWLTKAAEIGEIVAYYNLGVVYGFCFEEKDYEAAVYWYEKAAEGRYTDAYNRLGLLYTNHLPNRDKAIHWFKKAAEIGEGEVAVAEYYNLGVVYGNCFEEKDYEEAVHWYEKAAEGGYTDAYNQLGVIYSDHLPNRDKAIHWFKKAAEIGEVLAYYNLGVVYGKCFEEKDYEEAVHWYEKAAEGGYTGAYNKLGVIYMAHLPNRDKAIHWLTKAAEEGDADAYCNLGLLYGYCFEEKDYGEAVHWYEKAAEAGDPDTYNRLGDIYMDHLPNQEKAIYWNEKAATELENVEAMLRLGRIYETWKNDDMQAAQWYLKAIQYGSQEAQECFDKLSQKGGRNVKNETGNFFKLWKR